VTRAAAASASPAFDAAAIEAGQRLFSRPCEFVAGVAAVDRLPAPRGIEVAFAGRSNVGKSSLLNALTGRKALARVSHTPGRTQQINLFALGGALVLADLPGYGFAKAPERAIKRWLGLIDAYLLGRPNLRRVLLLIDARRGVTPPDRRWMKRFDEAAVVFQVVLTKVDKVEPGTLAALIAALGAELALHPAAHPAIAPTSAIARTGIPELRAALAQLASAA
jgi:GTP-binding protein